MCSADFCPCSATLDPLVFGNRSSEFEGLDLTGSNLKFYEDCYLGQLINKNVSEPLDQEFLALLERFEVQYDCGGICETNLFYFFGSNLKGSPPNNCKSRIIRYFWD
mmetsp:Transcript_32154/g.49169  ORF Transcript_32154/g.49169 Transcript_32154/m.49169 type:complete len:107 (-) Transcript_32154:62-382(-)